MDIFSPRFLALAFGLACALTWGAGDFSGGLAAKRSPVLQVMWLSQLVGGLSLVALLALCSPPLPSAAPMFYGAAAGLAGAAGILALYTALSRGAMGVAAPLSAVLTALLPVLATAWTEGLPPALRIAGMVLGFVAIGLLTYTPGHGRMSASQFWLCLGAGAGFGLFFIGMDAAGQGGLLWPLLAARIASLSLATPLCLLRKAFRMPSLGQLALITVCGLLDTTGNAFFVLATQTGRLDIAAILASLYPASTVLLASLVLRERLNKKQLAGVALALGALALISA
jgi:drug/metabolite transporter (DMT)-like permease